MIRSASGREHGDVAIRCDWHGRVMDVARPLFSDNARETTNSGMFVESGPDEDAPSTPPIRFVARPASNELPLNARSRINTYTI